MTIASISEKTRRSITSRAAIKAATQHAHEQVDRCYSRYNLADPHDYTAFLTAHSAVLPLCEQVLTSSNVTSLLPNWPDRQRSSALFSDLAAIGGRPDEVSQTVIPIGAAEAFGMLYVLEGSRLGGAVLARRVLANPDARCRGATRYLRHGQSLGLWPSFVTTMDESPVVARESDRVIASALRIFDLFIAAA